MSRLARFRFKTDMAVSQYSSLAQEFLFGPSLSETFLEYLITMHGIIRASEPLLQAAMDEANRRWLQGDQSCRGLADYFAIHKQEETNHAEWLLQDIEVMGVARDVVLNRQPSIDVAALVGSQYYWIYHYHPGLLFAYMVVLEAYSMEVSDIEQCIRQSGLPVAAFRTLRLHAELDPGHADDLFQFLDHCSFSDAVFESLSTSSIATCAYFAQILKALTANDHDAALVSVR